MRNYIISLCISVSTLHIAGSLSLAASTGDVVFNELMWMGSTASTADEWIELRNMTDVALDLSGWTVTRLSSGEETPMLVIDEGTIPAAGVFLISNYGPDSERSTLAAMPDLIATAVSLSNTKLQLKLYDGMPEEGAATIDIADDGVGAPAAGNKDKKCSMARKDPPGEGTAPSNWFTTIAASGWEEGAGEQGTPGTLNPPALALSAYSVALGRTSIELLWKVEETFECRWEIYRGTDRRGDFVLIGEVPVPDTSGGSRVYRFIDRKVAPEGIYYYYIERVSAEGVSNRSKIIRTSFTAVEDRGWGAIKKGSGQT